jgi:hypothetical protein
MFGLTLGAPRGWRRNWPARHICPAMLAGVAYATLGMRHAIKTKGDVACPKRSRPEPPCY